ncbi:hypothetical protein ONZ45_g16011 [Pleurotus djamor]|nr:hypothetical protein ONZ45_g16011 [Pleurotus djamor]
MSPSSVDIELVPPSDVTYFSSETIHIFKDEPLVWNATDHGERDAGRITWNVDVYKYATGRLPPDDPKFSESGSIILVLVHRGTLNVGKNTYERCLHVWPVSDSSGFEGTVQEPSTGSGVQQGDTWNYVIDYKETNTMLKNNGSELTSFTAKYHEDFALSNAKQTGFTGFANGGVGFYIQCQSDAARDSSFPIKGCSVFRSKDSNRFPLKCTFGHLAHLDEGGGSEVYSAYATKEVSISRGF